MANVSSDILLPALHSVSFLTMASLILMPVVSFACPSWTGVQEKPRITVTNNEGGSSRKHPACVAQRSSRKTGMSLELGMNTTFNVKVTAEDEKCQHRINHARRCAVT